MDLITDATAVTPQPAAPSPLTGTRGWFTGGVPGSQAATRVRAWWLNLVANELVTVVQNLGLVPSATNSGQLGQALTRASALYLTRLVASTSLTQTTLTPDQAGVVTVNAAAGPLAITLPLPGAANGTATVIPLRFRVVRLDSAAQDGATVPAVTVSPPTGATLQGVMGTLGSIAVGAVGSGVSVMDFTSDGANTWFVDYPPPPRGFAAFILAGAATFTAPAGVFSVRATAWDAGGGGGYGAANNWGAGGGGGGFFTGTVPVVGGASYPLIVGQGGTGGTSTSVNGNPPATGTEVTFAGGKIQFTAQAGGGTGNGGNVGGGGSLPTTSGLPLSPPFAAFGGQPGNGGTGVGLGGPGGGAFGGMPQGYADGVGNGSAFPGAGGGGGGGANGGDGAAGSNGAVFFEW